MCGCSVSSDFFLCDTAGQGICGKEVTMRNDMTIIGEEAYRAAKEILELAAPEPGELFVVGCSTSEVGGASIGSFSSPRREAFLQQRHTRRLSVRWRWSI